MSAKGLLWRVLWSALVHSRWTSSLLTDVCCLHRYADVPECASECVQRRCVHFTSRNNAECWSCSCLQLCSWARHRAQCRSPVHCLALPSAWRCVLLLTWSPQVTSLPVYRHTILQTHFKECTDARHIEIHLDDVNYFSAFIQTACAAQVQRRHNDSAGAATQTDDGAGAGGGEGSPGKRPETAARASPVASMHPGPAASTGKRHRAGAASDGAHLSGDVSTGKRRRAGAASVAGAPPVQDPSSASRHANPPASEDDLARLLGESLRRERTLKRRLKEAVRSLEYEQNNRHAAALTSRCPGVDLKELAALVGLAGRNDFAPCTASGGEEGRLRRSVFAIKRVHDTAGRVLAASSCTPAGILRSVLLKVTKPEDEVSSELLSHVMVYINREGGRDWTPRQRAHLEAANALAAAMTNKAIAGWQHHQGRSTLECMQVGPIVRQALATVFQRLHGYDLLRCAGAFVALTSFAATLVGMFRCRPQ